MQVVTSLKEKSHKNEISELTKTLTFNLLSGDTLTLKT